MNDSFKFYSLKIFNELNVNVAKKFDILESKEIEANINNLFKIEDNLNEIEAKLDSSINKLIADKMNNDIINELEIIFEKKKIN
jgi:hypothetical protein